MQCWYNHLILLIQSSGMEGEGPESLLIKEERLEEDLESSDSQRGLNAREESE